jgi:hypothetical protein
MTFDTITGASASTATTFGGEATNKISNFLNGSASEVANIYHSAFNIVDATTPTKKIAFNASNLSSSQTCTVYAKNNNNVNLGSVGTHELWIPAGAMYTRTTGGAAYTSRETTTNKVMVSSFNFDTTTQEYSQFNWGTPANWDAGTVRFKLYWTCTGGSSAQTIDFDLQGLARSDDDPLDTAFGTAQNVTDTYIADNDVHVTSYSSAITIAGSPIAGDNVIFQLTRDVASDNLGVDCEVLGILVEYSTNKSNSS